MESKVLGYGQGYIPASPARFPSQGDAFPNKTKQTSKYNLTILSNFDFMEKIDLLGKILSLFSKPTGFLTLAPS